LRKIATCKRAHGRTIKSLQPTAYGFSAVILKADKYSSQNPVHESINESVIYSHVDNDLRLQGELAVHLCSYATLEFHDSLCKLLATSALMVVVFSHAMIARADFELLSNAVSQLKRLSQCHSNEDINFSSAISNRPVRPRRIEATLSSAV
jgi:Ran GTPase-activating protein (RanGAP) involved in mRNA processing and transport